MVYLRRIAFATFQMKFHGRSASVGTGTTLESGASPGQSPNTSQEDLPSEEPNFDMQFQTSSEENCVSHKGIACPTCGKDFTLAGNLHRHMKTVHGETAWRCKHCGRTFARSDSFRRHRTTTCCRQPNLSS